MKLSMHRILIVDDEKDLLEIYKKALEEGGYDIQVAGSAEEALEINSSQLFQLYILDLNLPKMDGIDLCKIIKKKNPIAIVYGITGYASLFQLGSCREAGFDDYFFKPISLETLRESVKYAFNQIERWRGK